MNLTHPFRKKSEHLVEIQDLAFGGMGVAKVDNFVIFVENTIPGDQVKIRVRKKKSSYAEAYVLDYVKRGEGFVQAACDYADYCGGCKWQDLAYEFQLHYKQKQVEDSIQRIASLKNISVEKTIPSDDIFAYRNKMEFSFSDNRWLRPQELADKSISKSFALGLHVPGAFNKILDIEKCHIQDDIFNSILNTVADFVKHSGMSIYNLRSHEGIWRFLMLRKGVHSNEYMVNFVTSEDISDQIQTLVEILTKKHPEIKSIVNNLNRRKAQIADGEEEILLFGSPIIHEKLDEFKFEISANSFFQTNTKQAEKMYRLVKELVGEKKNKLIFDFYSGTGTIPIYLSDSAKQIIGFELVESSVLNARENLKRLNITNCEFVCGDVKETVPAYKEMKPDILIVDPPRAGIHKDVIESILFLAAKEMIYVSCNPTSLARDLGLLSEKYSIDFVQPIDMFPHTYHIESVVKLSLKKL